MTAEILSVGTELLLGDIVNTNAQYLAKQLASLGISVYYQTVVGDNEKRLMDAYINAFSRADIVITTGGLGPTDDDITKDIATKYFNKKLICDENTIKNIESIFERINQKPTKNNFKQAYFPENSIILKNDNGTAPGCLIEENNKMLFMLPGPPNEMLPMFENVVKPILKAKTDSVLFSKTIKICGIGESLLENMLKDLLDTQTNPTIALYAKTNEVHIRITSFSSDTLKAKNLIEPLVFEIQKRLGDNIYGYDDDTLENIIVKTLIEKKYKISIAESCTGGMLASRLIDVSGVSEVLLEGCITYSNDSKCKRLGVKKETLEEFGAVSEQTSAEMAYGVANFSNANIGVSTTGIAGPLGGTKEKPVGLVFVSIFINGKIHTRKLNIAGNRKKIRERATIQTLDFLRRLLLELNEK